VGDGGDGDRSQVQAQTQRVVCGSKEEGTHLCGRDKVVFPEGLIKNNQLGAARTCNQLNP